MFSFTVYMFKALLFLCSGAIIVIIGSNFKEVACADHGDVIIFSIVFHIFSKRKIIC